MPARILVNDDEAAIVQALSVLLQREGYRVVATRASEEALDVLRREPVDLLVTDICMRPMDGIGLLREARRINPGLSVILITGMGTVESAVDAMMHGAFDYVTKPFKIRDLAVTVQRALAHSASEGDPKSVDLAPPCCHFGRLVGENPAMRVLYPMIESLAATTATVQLVGEPGTELDLVAQAIHETSPRARQPFVTYDCAGQPEHEVAAALLSRGDADKPGIYFQAHGGTVFLANVQALSAPVQERLPAILRKLGPGQPGLDVRLIVSAPESVERIAARGTFASSLATVLASATLPLPPLRQRRDDLPAIAWHLLQQINRQQGTKVALSGEVLHAFEMYSWPQNMRELESVLQRAASRCETAVLRVRELPEPLRSIAQQAAGGDPSSASWQWHHLRQFIADKEPEFLERILDMTDRDHARAAAILGIDTTEFEKKLEQVLG